MQIIITRPHLSALQTKSELDNLGFDTIIAPMLEILELGFDKNISLAEYDLIIFSSQEAAKIFVSYYDCSNIEIYAVGDKSKIILLENNCKSVTSISGNIQNLKSVLKEKFQGKKILYPCGEDISDDFSDANLNIKLLKIYKAEYINKFDLNVIDVLKNKDQKLVIFLSRRTAKNFINLMDKYGYVANIKDITAICLSDRIKDRISELNWHELIVADRPDFPAVIDVLNKKVFK